MDHLHYVSGGGVSFALDIPPVEAASKSYLSLVWISFTGCSFSYSNPSHALLPLGTACFLRVVHIVIMISYGLCSGTAVDCISGHLVNGR